MPYAAFVQAFPSVVARSSQDDPLLGQSPAAIDDAGGTNAAVLPGLPHGYVISGAPIRDGSGTLIDSTPKLTRKADSGGDVLAPQGPGYGSVTIPAGGSAAPISLGQTVMTSVRVRLAGRRSSASVTAFDGGAGLAVLSGEANHYL